VVTLDWIVVGSFLLVILGVGFAFSKQASESMSSFFLSGRNLPWWLAGTSILATSFASDTPLHVTRVIREEGLGGVWFYWSGILTHLVVTFYFARLWRRSGVITDAELIELRYAGPRAAALRGTIGAVRGLIFEGLTLAWVILGMTKVVVVVLGLPATTSLPLYGQVDSGVLVVVILMTMVLIYSVSAGMWGVVVTDFIEFIVAMGGAVLLAVIAWNKAGGAEAIEAKLPPGTLDFFPDSIDKAGLALAVYLGVQWWANDSIDGSGKRAQRFLACRTEADALGSGVWNVAVQWILRTWPWYLTAIASIVLFPDLDDHELAYPRMMTELLPAGLRGLMVAAFLAAFMSTVDTHLNLCSAYLTNDVYKRFVSKGRTEKHYVLFSRIALVAIACIMAYAALNLQSVLDAFKLKMELMGGLGLVIITRWFWWRVNAVSELVALTSSIGIALFLRLATSMDGPEDFPIRMVIIVGSSTLLWVTATLIAGPEPLEHLEAFYRRVRPPGTFWGPVARAAPDVDSGMGVQTVGQALLCGVFAFSGMFGLGKFFLGHEAIGLSLCALCVISGWVLFRWLFSAGRGTDETHGETLDEANGG
jgi:Na+/proline symporter